MPEDPEVFLLERLSTDRLIEAKIKLRQTFISSLILSDTPSQSFVCALPGMYVYSTQHPSKTSSYSICTGYIDFPLNLIEEYFFALLACLVDGSLRAGLAPSMVAELQFASWKWKNQPRLANICVLSMTPPIRHFALCRQKRAVLTKIDGFILILHQ